MWRDGRCGWGIPPGSGERERDSRGGGTGGAGGFGGARAASWSWGSRAGGRGTEAGRRYGAPAALLLLCVEAGRMVAPEERELLEERPSLLVRCKADLVPVARREGEGGGLRRGARGPAGALQGRSRARRRAGE